MSESTLDIAVLDKDARELIPHFYQRLRRIARNQKLKLGLRSETLSTTVLVNESYLRLKTDQKWQDENHFLATAARAMRFILIDHVRKQLNHKTSLDEFDDQIVIEEPAKYLEVDKALKQLEQSNARLVRLVECRFFAAYTELETAKILGISERTVRRDWVKARAWLQIQLEG